ncbi:nucleotidyltransferase [Alkaliphilus peptidifermentans]|uniref:tRNA(Met) cytidine acetate ligase n=1 Tax=Alkaliphilus peptidifermentans DSM 18978 TaxID=1120976 RepID=A0A1G5JAW2_9FIRM|nr:nucleotidyltransferase [Alkaliphilus peptidifermentans]SCY85080.1 Predicted nucleotidyltransferase [Alkaliphilus peptidifermentans DSM 18978]
MNVLGLITEYNPFHNGHLYHLKESIKETKATHTVAVMSGNFLQRGEPALIHKWARAQMAVEAGVDLVIELPTVYACATAELFAFGSVKLLDKLGIIDSICFGSENGNIDLLKEIAEVLVESPSSFEAQLKSKLDLGLSFPAARGKALTYYFKEKMIDSPEEANKYSGLVESPNNILSVEYLKVLRQLKSSITPHTILRRKADYHSTSIASSITSATAIREYLYLNNNIQGLTHTLPATSYNILEDSFKVDIGPVFSRDFQQAIFTLIRQRGASSLKKIFDVAEGLENRIYHCSLVNDSLHDLYDCIKSKRYPYTRLQRIMMHLLLGIDKDTLNSFNEAGGPQYIRILAFNDKGRQILKLCKENSTLPVINKVPQFNGDPLAEKMLDIDIRATNIYTLGMKKKDLVKQQLDYAFSPIYVR